MFWLRALFYVNCIYYDSSSNWMFSNFVSGAFRSVRTLPECRTQHLSHDTTGLFYVDTVHRVAVHRHNDLPVLRTPQQRGAAESSTNIGWNVYETNTLWNSSVLKGERERERERARRMYMCACAWKSQREWSGCMDGVTARICR